MAPPMWPRLILLCGAAVSSLLKVIVATPAGAGMLRPP